MPGLLIPNVSMNFFSGRENANSTCVENKILARNIMNGYDRKGEISHSDLWQWNVDCSRDSASCELILCSDIHYQRLKKYSRHLLATPLFSPPIQVFERYKIQLKLGHLSCWDSSSNGGKVCVGHLSSCPNSSRATSSSATDSTSSKWPIDESTTFINRIM